MRFHQIVRYTRVREDGRPDRLIPTRVSWFHNGVKFVPLKRELSFQMLFTGHCQWIADQISPKVLSESQYNTRRRAA